MPATRVLFVEDDPSDAFLIQNSLEKKYPGVFELVRADSENGAVANLGKQPFDVCLLDLGLPDSVELSTLTRLQLLAPELPILILTGNDNEATGRAAVSAGAQDYISKSKGDGQTLNLAITYAMERKRREEELVRSAQYDDLTGLLRAAPFRAVMETGLARAARLMHTAAVYFIDLNHFKEINDHHGHKAGDQLLKEAARRLKRCLRIYDVLARIGGDEFSAFISDASSQEDCQRLAQRMQADFAAPFVLDAASVTAGLSIGIATALPIENIDADTLLKHADAAMYRAKADGGGMRFFQPDFLQLSN